MRKTQPVEDRRPFSFRLRGGKVQCVCRKDLFLVREKLVELTPMTAEEALVQTDLLGHDFYVFESAETGLVNVIYRRKNGGYGIIKPKIEEIDG